MSIKQEVKEVARLITTQIKCDLCGKVAPNPETADDNTWEEEYGDVGSTKVECQFGYQFPDCGTIHTISYHICPRCFKNKLVSWFKSQGVEQTSAIREW